MPSANSVFWIFTALQTQLILVMYVLMYATAIRLRRRHPETPRPFMIPGGLPGVLIVASVGGLACIAVVAINLFPPAQLAGAGESVLYSTGMVVGIVVVCLIPIGLSRRARPPSPT